MACSDCGISVPQLEPRSFSFNSPYGACPACNGLGSKYDFDPAKVIADWSRPLFEGGLGPGSGSDVPEAHAGTGRAGARFRSLDAVREVPAPRAESDSLRQSAVEGLRRRTTAKGRGQPERQERSRERKGSSGLALPGRLRFSGAQFRGVEFGHLSRMAHAVHVARAVRGLRRAAPASGKSGRESRRPFDRRIHRARHFRTRVPPWIKSAKA